MSQKRSKVKFAEDGHPPAIPGWRPAGIVEYPQVEAIRKSDGAKVTVGDKELATGLYSLVGAADPVAAAAPVAAPPALSKRSALELANMTIGDIRALPEWAGVDAKVKAAAKTKDAVISALLG